MGSSGSSYNSGGKNSWDDYLFPLSDVDDSFTEKLFSMETLFPAESLFKQATQNTVKVLKGEDDFGDHESWGGDKNSPFNSVVSSWLNPGYQNRQDWKEYYANKESASDTDTTSIDKDSTKKKKKTTKTDSSVLTGTYDTDESILI